MQSIKQGNQKYMFNVWCFFIQSLASRSWTLLSYFQPWYHFDSNKNCGRSKHIQLLLLLLTLPVQHLLTESL